MQRIVKTAATSGFVGCAVMSTAVGADAELTHGADFRGPTDDL